MLARLTILWDRLRNSLWALPIAMVIGAGALAVLALRLRLPSQGDPVWWLYSGDATSASALLANLMTATITMSTLVISITMVVLTLAAQSLGPRLIPIFMGDTRTKLTLGVFIGTVAYLLIVLRTVAANSDTVPQLAVTLGTSLVLASVIVLLFFVHHLARSIVADTIIARVGDTLDQYVISLLPESGSNDDDPILRAATSSGGPVASRSGGYVQFVDHGAITRAAKKEEAVVGLAFRPGQFVLPGDTLAWVKPPPAAEALQPALVNAVTLGEERTAVQDIEYSIRQLVEIALRALSPGVNDPNTACSAIDRLTQSMAMIMQRGGPPRIYRDGEGTIRLIAPATDFDGTLSAALDQIRQAGGALPAILIRLADRLGQLLAHANSDQAASLIHQLDLVQATGARAIPDIADRKVLETRVATARATDPRHQINAGSRSG